jgi:hypothetical protein
MINIVLFGKPGQERYSSKFFEEKYKLTHIDR